MTTHYDILLIMRHACASYLDITLFSYMWNTNSVLLFSRARRTGKTRPDSTTRHHDYWHHLFPKFKPIHPHFPFWHTSRTAWWFVKDFVWGGALARLNQQSSPTTTNHNQQQTMTQPEETRLDSRLEQTVLQLTSDYRPDSTSSIYDAKSQEYFRYCTSLYPQDQYAAIYV
jgi:hypothetical protein